MCLCAGLEELGSFALVVTWHWVSLRPILQIRVARKLSSKLGLVSFLGQ